MTIAGLFFGGHKCRDLLPYHVYSGVKFLVQNFCWLFHFMTEKSWIRMSLASSKGKASAV